MLRFPVVFVVTLMCLSAESADWPHWRGPDRNDVSSEPSGWDGSSWLKGDMWQLSVGEGSSAPVVVGDRAYFTGWTDGRDWLVCHNADTGELLWRRSYESPRYGRFAIGDQRLYSGACSTPEFDPETQTLFTLGIDGDLNAWDTQQEGRGVWSINLYDAYGAERRPEVAARKKTRRDYGYMSSPLVIENQLIVEVGGKSGNLVAFDKRTGRELWTSQNRDEAGHTGGPVPITVEGLPCVAVLTLRNLVVTDISDPNAGTTIAEYPWTTDFANNIATATVSGDSVIITSAYNHYAMCRVKVTRQGATKVWENNELASGVCSPIIHDGHVYWAWRGVHCVDFETGKEIWAGGKVGSQGSCILTSDDRLIVYANKGDLSLIETAKRSPGGFQQVATEKILSRTDAWPHVVLVNGRVICRDRAGTVHCLAVSSDLAAKIRPLTAKPAPTPAKPTASVKPVRPVKLQGDWPGTRDGLAIAWDRTFPRGHVLSGLPKSPEFTLNPREQASFSSEGALQLKGGAFILPGSAPMLAAAVRHSNEISIETVLTSTRAKQSGPARVVSFSSDGYSRNVTIGQEGDELILRLRTTRTGNNGMKPQVTLGRLPVSQRSHLVVSYRPDRLECWMDGKQVLTTDSVRGDFSNWDAGHHLLLGDEWDSGSIRKWHGSIERFAIYARAMTDTEVQQRYKLAGATK